MIRCMRGLRAALGPCALLVAVLTASPGGAQISADLLVLDADAESGLDAGAIIDGRNLLDLPSGSEVVLLAADGKILRLSGPLDGPPMTEPAGGAAVDPERLRILSRLIQDRRSEAGVGGPVRSGEVTSALPNPWAVNVHRDGPACARPDRIIFWRVDAQARGRLTIDMNAGGKKARLPWLGGQALLPVPASIFSDGRTYRIDLDGESSELTVHIPQIAGNSAIDWAVWMAQVGCKVQALAMIDAMR